MTIKFCPRCKESKNITEFYSSKNRHDGLSCYCKGCSKTISSIFKKNNIVDYNKRNREYQSKYRSYPENMYKKYKWDANRRGKSFNLSFDEFMSMWQKPCFYCNTPIKTIGIDRVLNNTGYEKGNVVPCCKDCNNFKGKMDAKKIMLIGMGIDRFIKNSI